MRSLRGRLILLLALLVAAALATGLLMVGLFRQSATARIAQAAAEVGRACDGIAAAYRFHAAGLTGSTAPVDDAARRDLTAVVQFALRNRAGVEGGVWQQAAGSLAYAFPTYEGAGPKTNVPEAELPRITAINRNAAEDDRAMAQRYDASTQTLLLAACLLPGPLPALTAWTMTRVFPFAGSAYRQLMAGLAVADGGGNRGRGAARAPDPGVVAPHRQDRARARRARYRVVAGVGTGRRARARSHHRRTQRGGAPARRSRPAGDTITIHGMCAAALPLVQAVSITDERDNTTIVDNGPPDPGHGPRPRPAPIEPVATAMEPLTGLDTVHGRVRMALHGPRGDVNGTLLDDGAILRLPPSEADRFADLLQPGRSVVAGTIMCNPLATVVDVRQLGASRDQLAPVAADRPPGPRPRR